MFYKCIIPTQTFYVTTQTIYMDINNSVSIIYREGENLHF